MPLRCDGTQAADGSAAPSAAPPDLVARFRAGLKPLGAAGLLLFGTQVKFDARARNDLPDLASLVAVDRFESKGAERLEGRDARVLDCVVTIKATGVLKVRLWIDPQTSLPLKREVEGTWAGMAVKIVETTSFAAGVEIKDEEFALP